MDKNSMPIICIIGSTKFKKEIAYAVEQETLAGKLVLTRGVYHHADSIKLTPTELDKLKEVYLEQINRADEVLVVDVDGYIGMSTQVELDYAVLLDKRISYYSKIDRYAFKRIDVSTQKYIESVYRRDDMSDTDKLSIYRDSDGDIVVSIIKKDMGSSSVEFCISGMRSKHTFKALKELAVAMEKDNEEYPVI